MENIETVKIQTEMIKLDQFIKWQNVASSGSEAKFLIAAGKVRVNEEIEYQRGRKLFPGDRIAVAGRHYLIANEI